MRQNEDASDEHVHPAEPIAGIFTPLNKAVRQPPDWIIEDLLPPGLTFLAGPPKSKKSTLTMAMACLVGAYDCQVLPPFLSVVKKTGPVMVFSAEATAGELRWMVEKEMKVDLSREENIIVADDPWQFRLDDEGALSTMLRWIEQIDPRLILIDPLRDFHALEEKDSGQMNRLLRPLRQGAVDNDASVVIVHHTRKPSETSANVEYTAQDMRGTSALFGIADGVLVLTPRKDEQLGVKATFKRAAGWERTITLAAYGETNASEVLGEIDRKVLEMIRLGEETPEGVVAQLHVGRKTTLECIERLYRNGYIQKAGTNAWRPKRIESSSKPTASFTSVRRSAASSR